MKAYHIVIFTLIVLAAVELVLEIKSNQAGWNTLLFGSGSRTTHASSPEESVFGPTAEFPFRSEILASHSGVRVWIGSSSYGEDVYLPAEVTFAHVAQLHLQERGLQAHMLNSSKAGWSTVENTAALRSTGPEWKPDIVVLYQGYHDVRSTLLASTLPDSDGPPSTMKPASDPFGFARAAGQLGERTTSYSFLKIALTAPLRESRLLKTSLPSSLDADLLSRLDDFVDASTALGATPVLTTFAVSTLPGQAMPARDRQQLLRWNSNTDPEAYVAAMIELNELVRTLGGRQDILVIDVADEVSGHSEFFRDFTHFTPEGHAAVGQVLAAGLAKIVEDAHEENSRL